MSDSALPDRSRFWAVGALVRALPTLATFLLLGGIAFWGHTHNWSLPGSGSDSEKTESTKGWCSEHHVPEGECVECRSDLYPLGYDYGWCKEHGVHNCPFCHPEVAQLKTIPKVDSERLKRANLALALRKRPENNNRCLLYRRRIQFASEEAISKAGIDIGLVEERRMVETIKANAEIRYDQRRVARLSSRAFGTVWRVEKEVGQKVKKGDILALVDSVEVGKAKAELLQALALSELKQQTVRQMKPLVGGAISGAKFLEAEAELKGAQIRLVSAQQTLLNLGLPVKIEIFMGLSPEEMAEKIRFLGLPRSLTSILKESIRTANLIPVYSPLDGIVVEREVVEGEVVDPKQELFLVADTRRLWLILDIPQEEGAFVKLGQKVSFRRAPGKKAIHGKITWISTRIDESTRTLKARAELDNPKGQLRASTFGTAQVVLREEDNAWVVPSETVQWDGSCHVVFVRDKNYFDKITAKLFHVRTIRTGVKADGFTEVIAGVLPGEVVAVKGSGVLRGQLLRNNLGAG